MSPQCRRFCMALFAALLLGLLIGRVWHSDGVATSAPAASPAAGGWSATHDLSAAQNMAAHWAKHGAEFPELHNATEYAEATRRFVDTPPPGVLRKQRPNGDTLFYDPASNTFAVKSAAGVPRTMFRPDRGRAYWNRQ